MLKCCGLPMNYQEFFGIRRYECDHRSHHPAIYVNLYTGMQIRSEDLEYHEQED